MKKDMKKAYLFILYIVCECLRAVLLPDFALASSKNLIEQASQISRNLSLRASDMEKALSARDRVRALTRTIQAYEESLSLMREVMREIYFEEAALTRQLEATNKKMMAFLSELGHIENHSTPFLLLHPDGPVASVRSGMLVSDVVSLLQLEAEQLSFRLNTLRDLRLVQGNARQQLRSALSTVQKARAALSHAIAQRARIPKQLITPPEVIEDLFKTQEVFSAFVDNIESDKRYASFVLEKGELGLPVLGFVLREPNEVDPKGVARPGVTLATRAQALVTAPWPATVRYSGRLPGYGNVIVLEPANDYLVILAGIETLYAKTGEIVPLNSPLGLMGGKEIENISIDRYKVSGKTYESSSEKSLETLYIEMREGGTPLDPTEWFKALKKQEPSL